MNNEAPFDYRPREPIKYMAIFMDNAEGIFMLEDEEAGRIFKRLYQIAADYSKSYDPSLEISEEGLSILGKYVGNQLASGVKRAEESRRQVSYRRSKENGGGRPEKT